MALWKVAGALHRPNLMRVCSNRFHEFNLKLKPKKCELFKDEVEFLGKLVSAKGVSVSPSKVDAVKK
jgi:hypothetical protein